MKKNTITRVGILVVITIVMAAVLSSCIPQIGETEEEKAQKAHREYMSQVNRLLDSLTLELDAFGDAVAEENAAKMNSHTDKVKAIIVELRAIKAPEGLAVVHNEYVTGCDELREALEAYVTLYTALNSATEEEPFDYATFNEELQKVKKKYDSGIKHLETGDAKALEMP